MTSTNKKKIAVIEKYNQEKLRNQAMKKGVTLKSPETVFLSKDTKFGKNVVVNPYVVIGKKTKNIKIIGVKPKDGARIPGIRRWREGYLPAIFKNALVDEIIDVSQDDAEKTTVQLAKKSGLFCGISSGANIFISRQISNETEKSCIVTIICDRGDRYLSKI